MACDNIKRHIPPRWKVWLVTAILFYVFLDRFFSFTRVNSNSSFGTFMGITAIVMLIGLLRLSVSYAVCNDYLEARFLGIPFRRIKWHRVKRMVYLHAWRDIHLEFPQPMYGFFPHVRIAYGHMVYVELNGGMPYIPTYNIRMIHSILHPFTTACIWLPYKSKEYLLQIIRECYPNLEIQPLDDLKKF